MFEVAVIEDATVARTDLPRCLIELAEELRTGNVTKRMMRAKTWSYIISPCAPASAQPDSARSLDELSTRWLLAVSVRLVREVGSLIAGEAQARKRVATFAIEGRCASPPRTTEPPSPTNSRAP